MPRYETNNVDQRKASALGDNVGHDKITNIYHAERQTQIEGWVAKLAEELREHVEVRDLVDNLQYYFQRHPYDDVVGLEAKLDRAARSMQKRGALKKKEAFAKLLAEWQAYPAAQEIIAYFLAKIECSFESHVVPMLGHATAAEIDGIVMSELIEPVLAEMGCAPFMLNHMNVSGMVYWLAEQCYVRWHV
jgi:hypothetical protein